MILSAIRYLQSFEVAESSDEIRSTNHKLWGLLQEQQDEIKTLTNKLVSKNMGEFHAMENNFPDGPDEHYVNDTMEADRWEESLRRSGFSDEDIEIMRVGD